MLDLGGVRDRAEFTRRLAVTAALLVVYRLGSYIPLPGINARALSQHSGTAAERISIFALGITPFITILILAELVKVLSPRVRCWEHAAARNRDKLNRMVVGLSLLAAAVQASGLALALEDVRHLVDAPGIAFRFISIATLVGGTAIVIWLADQITRHGLGSGAWLILATFWLAELPTQIAGIVWQGPGGAAIVTGIFECGLAALVLAAIVGLVRAGGAPETAATCLWSRLLASTVWPWLILGVGVIVGGGSLRYAAFWVTPSPTVYLLQILLLAGLVALFAHLYVRSLRVTGEAVQAIAPNVLALALAVIVLAELVPPQFEIFIPLGGHLVIVAVLALSLLARWWQPPFAAKDA